MANQLGGKVAAVTGAASGIGLACAEAMIAEGARVVFVDRDEAAVKRICEKHGDAAIPLIIDLISPESCATLLPKTLELAGQLDILLANAGTYIGGDLVDADSANIDRLYNLNVNAVVKNVHDVLPHMIERRTGDIIVTCSTMSPSYQERRRIDMGELVISAGRPVLDVAKDATKFAAGKVVIGWAFGPSVNHDNLLATPKYVNNSFGLPESVGIRVVNQASTNSYTVMALCATRS